MKPTYVILEYGLADGTENPTGYIPSNSEIVKQSSEHMNQIAGVIRENAKYDFRIVSLPISVADKWLEDNKDDIFVLSASTKGFASLPPLENYKNDFYMACSAGNDGKDGEGWNSKYDFFTSVGAIKESTKELRYYSAYGKGYVDFVGFIKDGKTEYIYQGKKQSKHLEGTSFSCPQHATQIMNLMMAYYEKYGIKPRMSEVLAVRDSFITDLLEKGKDLKTGWGYYQFDEKHLDSFKKPNLGGENMKIYNTIDEVEEWAKPTVQKLIDKKALKGDDKGNLMLTTDLIRTLAILDRLGKLD